MKHINKNNSMVQGMGIARTTATKDLNTLVKKGIVTRIGRGKRELRYILTLHRKSSKDVQKDDEDE